MRHVRSEKERFDAFKMFRGFSRGASSGFLAVHKKVHKQHRHVQTSKVVMSNVRLCLFLDIFFLLCSFLVNCLSDGFMLLPMWCDVAQVANSVGRCVTRRLCCFHLSLGLALQPQNSDENYPPVLMALGVWWRF